VISKVNHCLFAQVAFSDVQVSQAGAIPCNQFDGLVREVDGALQVKGFQRTQFHALERAVIYSQKLHVECFQLLAGR
jgi:hypothetical protein